MKQLEWKNLELHNYLKIYKNIGHLIVGSRNKI